MPVVPLLQAGFSAVSKEELNGLLEEASARGEVMAGRSKRKAALNSGLVHEDASKQAKVCVPDEDDDEEAEFEF